MTTKDHAAATVAALKDVFRTLRVTSAAEQSIVRHRLGNGLKPDDAFEEELDAWQQLAADLRHYDPVGEVDRTKLVKWHNTTLRQARALAERLEHPPWPLDFVIEAGHVWKIAERLSVEPHPAHPPKADYRNLTALVARVAPIYTERTDREVAAGDRNGSGPFVRLMKALLVLAGRPESTNAIRMAIEAHKANMKKSAKH